MKIISLRIQVRPEGQAPSIKFNYVINKHFPKLIFFFKSIFSCKNWQGGGELLLKNGTIDGYAY